MDISDDKDKSWDHPWTTEEMRKKRREWSLAGDAGLLKHLQQFSENLVSKTNKTEEALHVLTTQLTETAILIDNVTNTSLALANTQFIESRVQDDDVEIEKKAEKPVEEIKDQDLVTADLIATVSESVRQGLNIMDEKYRQMEVIDSDSEEEDDAIVLSVILGPNNPYQDRPLPYVIGSEKWKNSTKIGLESSSSESEQIDEEDEASDSDKDTGVFDIKSIPKVNVSRLSSSSSELDTYNQHSIPNMKNGKMDSSSQNNVDSLSESPIDNVSKGPLANSAAPNFAEELAKRLGTVRQTEKPITVDERSEASINRLKDDLFSPEEEDNALNKTDNVYTASKQLFNDPTSTNSWKEKPIKPYKSNIIPASVDVPPPISTISTKPKSAIDDLFGDADSEDSDDIFSSKSSVRKISKDANTDVHKAQAAPENTQKKHLNLVAPAISSNMATSTPETNANTTNLFSDDEDVGDLFSASKGPSEKSKVAVTPNKKKLPGSVPILGNILASDIEKKVLGRIPRNLSSSSSDSNTPSSDEDGKQSEVSRNVNNNVDDASLIVQQRHNAANLATTNESSYSSGISIHPPSINNTGGSSIGVDFQPQLTSTRLKSEEIYRERVASDSLFVARSQNPINSSNNSNPASNQTREERSDDTSSAQQNDVFENEDLFGPPPLPKSDTKATKSKVSSLFDDSDSGDELFSTTSSGSRSQKSTDFLATTPQYAEKTKPTHRRGLFDEDIDIFGSKDAPDVDIFGITAKSIPPKEENKSTTRKLSESTSESLFKSANRAPSVSKETGAKAQDMKAVKKTIGLFDDDDDDDDGDLFSSKPIKTDVKTKNNIFRDETDDLFSSKNAVTKNEPVTKVNNKVEQEVNDVSNNSSLQTDENRKSDILSGKGLFSTGINSHSSLFEDDDYDDLFGGKSTAVKNKVKDEKPVVEDVESRKAEQIHNKDIEEFRESQSTRVDSNTTDVNPTPDILTKSTSHISGEDVNLNEEIKINKISDAKEPETESKRSPPRTLDIQGDLTSLLSEDNEKGQRRTVSGKIKNLMGKMGDLKILSPMDTPPLSRRSEEKADEEDNTADRDSDDGGCMSVPGHSTPSSISESSVTRKQSLPSTASGGSNIETAISFDEPAQVETLPTAASKTRVRIQAKRRPQSRHARKSALRHSGIDFDTVDAADSNLQKEDRTTESVGTVNNEIVITTSVTTDPPNSDRLTTTTNDNTQRVGDSSMSLGIDDKSELGSLSKESSMSANKNTLLSPSTDEEDLFDVPPDLPEDPQKEDALFSRAPILSPVDRVLSEKIPSNFKPLRDTHISAVDETVSDAKKRQVSVDHTEQEDLTQIKSTDDHSAVKKIEKRKESMVESRDDSVVDEPTDPLRDSSHDPLKDPSQLFAFVTKTPSPEKAKSLLFSEDDSLFSSGLKKVPEATAPKKQVLDLFAEDTEGDLFSSTIAKPVKKPLKDTKISLFDDDNADDDDGSLFGPISKKISTKSDSRKSSTASSGRKRTSLFNDDDNDTDLFRDSSGQSQKSEASTEASEQMQKTETLPSITEPKKVTSIKDIFGDQSSSEDDIFASKPASRKVVTSKSLFPSDRDDSSEIFPAPSSTAASNVKPADNRPSIKKPITRDLKKTAEKIVEDPLSLLQDD